MATPAASGERLDGDALIELARSSEESRRLARWNRTVGLAALFCVVAIALLLAPAQRELSVEALLVTTACYALAARVQFEYADYFAVPTEGLFVAMWFLLPPRMLPLVVCLALLLATVPELVRGRRQVERLALTVGSAWHAVGPALVFLAAGARAPRWQVVPLCLAALAAQFLFELATSYWQTHTLLRIRLLDHLRASAPGLAVDAMLAPLGLLVAFPAYRHPWALLVLMPVLLLFSTFAKERQQHIDNALELSSAYRGTAMLLGDVIEADDEYTGSHSRDVVELAVSVADRLGLHAKERQQAEFAALLHDVGKVKIPAEIINKQGPLDDDEWALMKTHTILGQEMLERAGGLLGEIGPLVRSCHEHWDGNGYPDRLAGEQIPLVARIVCACDAWSAMTADRSYRSALSLEEATAELRRCAGTQFDPRVVDALLTALSL
jgi:HD-GYP domain-containing protein (c-di-GMP phosphodiesterase class II)